MESESDLIKNDILDSFYKLDINGLEAQYSKENII